MSYECLRRICLTIPVPIHYRWTVQIIWWDDELPHLLLLDHAVQLCRLTKSDKKVSALSALDVTMLWPLCFARTGLGRNRHGSRFWSGLLHGVQHGGHCSEPVAKNIVTHEYVQRRKFYKNNGFLNNGTKLFFSWWRHQGYDPLPLVITCHHWVDPPHPLRYDIIYGLPLMREN